MSEQGQAPPPPEPPNQNDPQAARPAPDQVPEQPAATAAEAPAAPIPPAAAPVKRSRVKGFARHRATQLVAVGLLGLVLGGGIVGAIAANRFDDRPGHMRVYERGHDRFEQRGDRFEGRPGDRFER